MLLGVYDVSFLHIHSIYFEAMPHTLVVADISFCYSPVKRVGVAGECKVLVL